MSLFKVPIFCYRPLSGYYGGVSTLDKFNWYVCREQFHADYKRFRRLFFVAHENNTNRVASFIRHAERILKLPEEQKSTFHKTNTEGILLVKMGKFWTKCKMRRSLYTILLRASKNYDRNFHKAAAKEPYLADTWGAVTKFMDGNTKIKRTNTYNGWASYFSDGRNLETLTK